MKDGFIKAAAASPELRVADVKFNTEESIKCIKEAAENGAKLICDMVDRMNMPHVVEQLRKLEAYGHENEEKYPWMPSAWNTRA